jgi:HEAT repeat protein
MQEPQELLGLVGQFANAQLRYQAFRQVQTAGAEALPAIREGLSHPDWRVRQLCAMLLDHVWDEPSLRRLVLALHDPKLKVRRAAVHSLGCDRCKGGENPIDAVPLLAERLREDKSIKVRRMAAWTLAIQPPDRRIARILRRVLRDETDVKLRRWADFGIRRYEQSRAVPAEA